MAKVLHPSEDFGSAFHCRPEKAAETKKLKIVMAITLTVMIVEIVGGVMANSLALISDAGHMLTHLFALAMTLFSIMIACRPASLTKTFGYYRAEVLAALFNSITIIIIVAFILFEAYRKLVHPEPVAAIEMFAIAVMGLVANLVSAYILRGSVKADINMKGAFYHLLSDTISSVAVVFGGLLILFYKFYAADPIISVIIGVVVLIWGIRLFRDSVHILLESTPKNIEIEKVVKEMKKVGGVKAVHDMHVWELTSGMYALTAHVIVGNKSVRECARMKRAINGVLEQKFGIGHTTLQFEEK